VEAGRRQRVKLAFELAWSTPPAWADAALAEPLALLSDHAHCELGAAAAAQGLLARRPEDARLVERLSALAQEELAHFRRVHRLLCSLGGALEPVRKNPYAEGLLALAERGPRNLLDRLLVAALIERRSLERFELLARAATGQAPLAELADLYGELAPSESGHAHLFVELARDAYGAGAARERLAFWVEREAALVSALPFVPRIHSGPPAAPAVSESDPLESGARAADPALSR